ncbi:MAG TPA: TolC family protein [Candidatus Limnocylindrales bacterium]|jgi:outer membrane protein TolC|nr:TolC family protein [Candidatus Limnocylindrales bacterium]
MRLLRILLVLAGVHTAALAQTNTTGEARPLTLQEAIELALKHNLDLQIDRYNPLVSFYGLKANYGDYDPTLNLQGSHSHNEAGSQLLGGGFTIPGSVSDSDTFLGDLGGKAPWGMTYDISGNVQDTYGHNFGVDTNGQIFKIPFENSRGNVNLSVTQPLLRNFWIDSTRLNIHVAKNRLKYSEVTLKLQIMQILTTLEQAYYDLIYNRENLTVQQKAVELAERLVMENRKRLEVGALAPLDLQSAEAQAASSRAAVFAAKSQLDTQERLVKSLITDRYLDDWSAITLEPVGTLTAVPPVVNLRDSWSKGLSQRPELQQAKLDIERAGLQLKYDRNQLYPELDVFGSYGFNGSGSEFSDALYDIQRTDRPVWSYGGKISIPLANLRARNNYKSTKANLQQLTLALKQLEQNTMILIDNDIGTIRANYDQVQATRAAREFQEAALAAEQKKLESGKSTTYTVLQVQRDLTSARGSEIQALDAYNKSLSQLSLHEGTTLQRLNVNLEVK